MPSLRLATYAAVALLAYSVQQSPFVQNIPFHLRPPSLPAQLAHLPHARVQPSTALEAFTAHSSPVLDSAERLAFCEDAVHFHHKNGRDLVLVSCDPNRKRWNTVMGPLADPYARQGALWVVDPVADAQDAVMRVQLDWAALDRGQVEFHPLGIEVLQDGEGDDRLFVINHRANFSEVEVFTLAHASTVAGGLDYRATHLFTLSHRSFTGAPNSIALLSRTSFFLSHDHHNTRRTSSLYGKLANFVETVGALPNGRVDYVSFREPATAGSPATVRVTTVAEGISFANGLALSPAHDTLVVASTTRRTLLFYSVAPAAPGRTMKTPVLSLRQTVHLPMLVDNLSLLPSPSGTLAVLAAGHPSYPALLSAAHNLDLRVRLPRALRKWARALGAEGWAEWELSWRADEQRGMSWAVVVRDPPVGTEDGGREWETVYQSNGRIAEGGFGGSTTAVAGTSEVDGKERAWMVVAGLYEEGVRIVRA